MYQQAFSISLAKDKTSFFKNLSKRKFLKSQHKEQLKMNLSPTWRSKSANYFGAL